MRPPLITADGSLSVCEHCQLEGKHTPSCCRAWDDIKRRYVILCRRCAISGWDTPLAAWPVRQPED